MGESFLKWGGLALLAGVAANASAAEPVLLTSGDGQVLLAGHIDYLRDDSGKLTLEEVRSQEYASRFVSSQSTSFNFGFKPATYWYRTTVRSGTPDSTDWVLELGFPPVDLIDLYLLYSDGRSEALPTGDQRPPPSQQLPSGHFAFPLRLAPGDAAEVYARATNGGAQLFAIELWPETKFREKTLSENLVYGAFFGIMLAMALFNLVVGYNVRDRAYLYFVLFLAPFSWNWLVTSGYARLYGDLLIPEARVWISDSFPFALSLSSTLFVAFGAEFIQIGAHSRFMLRCNQTFIGLGIAVFLLQPVLTYATSVQLSMLYFAAALAILYPHICYLAYRGIRTARNFVAAFGVFIFCIAVSYLQFSGKVAGTSLMYAQPIGATVAVILLSLALADRINSERHERERLTRLKNFFAPQVAEAILEEGGGSLLSPRRREVTVVFSDLRGFTALAAQSEPEDVIRVLREYHEAVVETAAKHGGNVEHIAGDGVMVYFNAPVETSEPEMRAVRMAFDLRRQFETLCGRWRKRGHELGVGIGMACGFATVGAVGAKGRMDYSCIGTVTNLAARLCAQAKHGQILAPQQFMNRIETQATGEALGEQELKGIPKPVAIYNLAELKPGPAIA